MIQYMISNPHVAAVVTMKLHRQCRPDMYLMGEDVISERVFVEEASFALRARERIFAHVLLQVLLVTRLRRKLPTAQHALVVLLSREREREIDRLIRIDLSRVCEWFVLVRLSVCVCLFRCVFRGMIFVAYDADVRLPLWRECGRGRLRLATIRGNRIVRT